MKTVLRAFLPTVDKAVCSLIVLGVWAVFLWMMQPECRCIPGGFEGCTDYGYLAPVRMGCDCECLPFQRAAFLDAVLLAPAVVFYLGWSALRPLFRSDGP